MAAAFLPSTTAIGLALSRTQLHSIGISWLLLLCVSCGVCGLAPSALAQSATPAAAVSFGSSNGFTYQVPGIGPRIIRSKAHDTAGASSPPQPDVQALDVTWSPANPQVGDPVKFSALVTNLGDAPAPEYTVEFYLKNETGEISYFASYWDPQPLNPGESRWVTGGSNWDWGFWTATPGIHIALVVINDSYNSLTKLLYVPSAPLSSLTAVGSDGQINLSWTAVPGAASYNLYRSATPGGEGGTPYQTRLTATDFTDAPVANGTTYYYTFTAVNAQGESVPSNEASATAQPPGMGRVRFFPRAGFEGRMLGGKFQGSNDGASYTDLATIASVSAASQYTQQALSADPKLFRYLRYLSSSGGCGNIAELEFYSGTSANKLTGTLFGTPGSYNNSGNDYTKAFDNDPNSFFDAPVGDGAFVGIRQGSVSPFILTAIASTSQIALSWTSVAGASGYNVRRGTVSGGPYTVIAPGCTGTSYADNTALIGVPYFYMVTALSSGGESAFSNEAIAKIGSVLAPYSGSPVSIAASGTTTVEAENYDLGGQGIAFNDIDNGNQSAYRSDNIGVQADGNASNGYVVGYAQGSEWDGYMLNVVNAGTYALTATVGSPSSGGTFHLEFGPVGQIGGAGVVRSQEITVPSTGGWGSYQVVPVPAVNLPAGPLWMRLVLDYGGNGRYVASFDCFSFIPSVLVPVNLTATAGSGQIILAWNASSGAVSYNLYRSTTAGGEGRTPYQSGLTGTGYTDTNVTPGTTYYYTATAVNTSGESAQSNEANATAQAIGFSLTLGHPSLSIAQGDSRTVPITVTTQDASDAVTFSVSGVPFGIRSVFVPASVTGPGAGRLVLTADAEDSYMDEVTPGTYLLTVTATSGGVTRSRSLTVQATPTDYSAPHLTLTAAGAAAGFGLTTFASNFPCPSRIGPLGVAFTQGGVLVSDDLGDVRLFSTDADNQDARQPPVTVTHRYGPAGAIGLASVGSALYMTQQSASAVLQIDEAGGSLGQVAGIDYATGIVANPANGHLFVTPGTGAGLIYDVNPVTGTSSLWSQGSGGRDGMTISGDGGTLYAVAGSPGDVLGYDTTALAPASPSQRMLSFDLNVLNPISPVTEPDGIAIGSGALAGQLYVNANNGRVWQVDLTTGDCVQVATADPGGLTRGDFATPDPTNGSLLLTQSDRILRLVPPTGGRFGQPPPAPIHLMALPGNTQVSLLWTAVLGATGYSVERATTSGGPYMVIATNWPFATYTDTGLANGTTYYYVVCAVNGFGTGTASNEASATPQAALADFALSAASARLSVALGQSGTVALAVTPLGGFAGAVALSVFGVPAGVTAAVTPSATGGTLTLSVGATARPGRYVLAVTGVSGSLTRQVSITLTVPAPDFTLTADTAALTLAQGASGAVHLTVAPVNGFAGAVFLSLLDPDGIIDNGVDYAFSPDSLTLDGANPATATLTLTAGAQVTPGTYSLQITGTDTSGALVHSAPLFVTVTAPAPAPDFQLQVDSAGMLVVPSGSDRANISVQPVNGFSGTVNLNITGLPVGVTASFSQSQVSAGNGAGGSSVLTLNVGTNVTYGDYPLTIKADGPNGLTHTATLTLSVIRSATTPGFDVSADSSNVDAEPNSSDAVNLTVAPNNGFIGQVTFYASGLPSGVSAVFQPATCTIADANSQSSILMLVTNGLILPGYYPLTVTATSGNSTAETFINLRIAPTPNATPFNISTDTDVLSFSPMEAGTTTVTVAPIGGFSGDVAISLADDPVHPILGDPTDPTKISTALTQSSVAQSGSTDLTLQFGATAPEGMYHLTVIGISNGQIQTTPLTVFVLPDFGLAASEQMPQSDGSSDEPFPTDPLASSEADLSCIDLYHDASASFVGNNLAQSFGMNQYLASANQGDIFAEISGLTPLTPAHPRNDLLEMRPFSSVPPGDSDDRIEVPHSGNAVQPPYTTVCLISVTYGKRTFQGSGVLIGNNHVLTAAHVVTNENDGSNPDKILVFPGYFRGVSPKFGHTFAPVARCYVPSLFKRNTAKQHNFPELDDWALLDLAPVQGVPKAVQGQGAGVVAGHMTLTDDFESPDIYAGIAGYPAFVRGLDYRNPRQFYSFVYNGNDGPVYDRPTDITPDPSSSEVFYTIDVTPGNSGGPIYDIGDDGKTYVYAVVNRETQERNGRNTGALINANRLKIIRQRMTHDKNDVPDF